MPNYLGLIASVGQGTWDSLSLERNNIFVFLGDIFISWNNKIDDDNWAKKDRLKDTWIER